MGQTAGKGRGGNRLLIALLLGFAAAGAWNYRRNLVAENQVFRPYGSYADRDLGPLMEAHREEIETLTRRLEAARAQPRATGQGQRLGERIEGFTRVREAGERLRALERTITEREAALRDLEAERAQREAERDRLRMFFKRLLTV